jgi:class 3 adenylate cyclase/hemoglobin-like flavoprotein
MLTITYNEPPQNVVVTSSENRTLLDISLEHDIPHYHECGGQARCSTCRVLVLEGLEHLSDRTEREVLIAQRKHWPASIRLACQARALGNLTVKRLVVDDEDVNMVHQERPRTAPGREQSLAIMFCDIRNFTKFANEHLPYDVIHVLNRYYQLIGDPILANRGFIDKYMGDGILALFGLEGESPEESCMNAIRASLRLLTRLRRFNHYLQRYFNTEFKIGIALHYGPVVLGELGHHQKMQFTVLGDAVNGASRIEEQNKIYGTTLLASDALITCVRDDVEIGRSFGVELRGQSGEQLIHEVIDFRKPDALYLVQSTYELIAPQADDFAALFYEHLFGLDPEIRALFQGAEMKTMRTMFMNMLSTTIQGLDRLDGLLPSLQELGQRHRDDFKVLPYHYRVGEQALHQTLKRFFGKSYTPEVEEGWRRVYRFIAETMNDGSISFEPSL